MSPVYVIFARHGYLIDFTTCVCKDKVDLVRLACKECLTNGCQRESSIKATGKAPVTLSRFQSRFVVSTTNRGRVIRSKSGVFAHDSVLLTHT